MNPSPRATRECVLLRDRKVQKHTQPAQAQKWVQIPHKDEPKPQMRLEFELLAVQICRSPRWSTNLKSIENKGKSFIINAFLFQIESFSVVKM